MIFINFTNKILCGNIINYNFLKNIIHGLKYKKELAEIYQQALLIFSYVA